MVDIELQRLCQQVQEAYQSNTALEIQGSGSKSFLSRPEAEQKVRMSEYQGVVQYDPTELVITAKAGTPIAELEATLAEKNQILAFEPPRIQQKGTLGGMVASALAGPRRPFSGGVRDYVLGLSIINGQGQSLRFGGQVMKNVAGFDVSRLMVGSMGCLGLLTDVSLKVLPKPECQQHYRLETTLAESINMIQRASKKMTPITGLSHDGEAAYLRIEGRANYLAEFAGALNLSLNDGVQENLQTYWSDLRHHQHALFNHEQGLWQLSLPKWTDLSPILTSLNIAYVMDWAGARYWLLADATQVASIKDAVLKLKGHLCDYRDQQETFYPAMSAAILKLHQNLKQAYDPAGILNPGLSF